MAHQSLLGAAVRGCICILATLVVQLIVQLSCMDTEKQDAFVRSTSNNAVVSDNRRIKTSLA
jgi:hypothetical protein